MRELTWTDAVREALAEEMARDPTIFVLGEGIGARGGNFNTTTGLYDLYGPERLRDTPICERGFVGLAVGAAMTGTRPVVDFMFVDFILDAFGEMVNQMARIQYMSSGRVRMPVVLRGCVGVGGSAATHHSATLYPVYGHIPGLRVVVPSNPADARALFRASIRCDDPVLFLEHRLLLNRRGPVPEKEGDAELGKARVVREGGDITVASLGIGVPLSLAAAEALSGDGIEVEVVDLRGVAPLDTDPVLESVGKTGRLLIVDEGFQPFGVGAEVAARVADAGFDDLDAPIRRLNGAWVPTPYSAPLEAAVKVQPHQIRAALRALAAE